MIDTHTHIYLPEFDADKSMMLERAKTKGVKHLLLPSIEQGTYQMMYDSVQASDNYCKPMMGLHPCSVNENYVNELSFVENELFCAKSLVYYGVGEIGLDFYWDKTFLQEQKIAFKKQLEWATVLSLPVSIHSRESTQDCIDIVKSIKTENLNGVFHCFGGTVEEAKQIIDLDFKLGIGGVVTYKKAALDITLKEISLSNIVLETDAPYLSPVPQRGKRNEPAFLEFIVNKLSEIYQISTGEVISITNNTAMSIFKLN